MSNGFAIYATFLYEAFTFSSLVQHTSVNLDPYFYSTSPFLILLSCFPTSTATKICQYESNTDRETVCSQNVNSNVAMYWIINYFEYFLMMLLKLHVRNADEMGTTPGKICQGG
jgi:hypothetical protein